MNFAINTEGGRPELCALLKDMHAKRGAEIGVWEGDFSEFMCRRIPGVHLTLVDPWLQYKEYNEAKNNQTRMDLARETAVARMKPYPHVILQMSSIEAAKLIAEESLDFVYIDGNHYKDFVKADLEAWYPKVRSGGVMSGHDYEIVKKHKHVEVKEAVDAFAEAHGIDTITILLKHKAPSWYWVKP